jgi:hypothetical protein
MKQDRFLTGILIGIAVLVVVALVVFFTRKDTLVYGPDDNPAGVVQNYAVALYKHDYEKAYGYLADLQNKPTLQQFKQAFFDHNVDPANTAVDLGKVEINGNSATVALSINTRPTGPFSSEFRNAEYAQLVNQNGAWKLKQMPQYNFWAYDWYTATPGPVK